MGKVVKTLFGGSSQKQQSTQQSNSQLDPRMFDMFSANRDRAAGVAGNLQARQFAGFTPDYFAGRDQIMSTAGGQGQQSVMGAQNVARDLAGAETPLLRDMDVGSYMNPFLNTVAGNTVNDMERARQMAQMQNSNAATAASAFGGSRQGIVEAETNRNYFDRLGNTLGSLYATGFDTAAGLAGRDQDAMMTGNVQRLAAAGLLGNLGNLDQSMALERGGAMTSLGMAEQQLNQAQMDAIRNLPLEQQAIINEALGLNVGGGSGAISSSTGQSSGTGSSQKGIIPGLTGGFSALFPGGI